MAMFALMLGIALSFDLDAVKAEPNLDRRAELALNHANEELDHAKNLYASGEYKQSHDAVIEVKDSVELCYESLKATGKDPRKNSKQFKKVEMRIHALVRRVKGFAQNASIEDRPVIQQVQRRLEDINDEIVNRIFTKSK